VARRSQVVGAMRFHALLVLTAGCGNVAANHPPDASADASIDTDSRRCDPTKPFADVRAVEGVNSVDGDEYPSMSPDELTMYFASNRASPGTPDFDIYVAQRTDRDAAFGAPVRLTAVSSGSDDRAPSISADGLTLFLHSSRNSADSYDLFAATRASLATGFSTPVALGADINTTAIEEGPAITSDGGALYFERTTTSTSLLRASLGATGFASPVALPELGDASSPAISSDELTIYFASDRGGNLDIWTATRTSTASPFGAPSHVDELASSSQDFPTWISPDGCRMYFWSGRSSSDFDIWQATRPM
jgi:Tol biopolymer transport system component